MTEIHIHDVTTGEYAITQTRRPNGDYDIIVNTNRVTQRGAVFIDPEDGKIVLCDWHVLGTFIPHADE